MIRRLGPILIFGLIPLFIIGSAIGWAFWKIHSIPREIRSTLTLLQQLRYQRPIHELAEKHLARLLVQYPNLKIEEHPVPADENGFLLLQECGYSERDPFPISTRFEELLHGKNWNTTDAQQVLADHAEVVAKIDRIAALKTHSSANLPPGYAGLSSIRPANRAAGILLLQARLVAEAGDEAEALKYDTAALNIAAHLRGIESPTLLTETIATAIKQRISREIFKHQLPALKENANLEKWKSLFLTDSSTPARLAQVMRGEWNYSALYFALPTILKEHQARALPDPDSTAQTYAQTFSSAVDQIPTYTLIRLQYKSPLSLSSASHLSHQGQDFLDIAVGGFQSHIKNFVSYATVAAQNRAAIELLCEERRGHTFQKGALTTLTLDPVTGDPFLFDPSRRTVSPPASAAADLNASPLTLPW